MLATNRPAVSDPEPRTLQGRLGLDVIVRCTTKMLALLGGRSVSLVDAPPSEEDWYANVLWFNRRKCLLIAHAGTHFPLLVADVRAAELRPFGPRIVGLIEGALLEEGLPIDALKRLDPGDVHLAKTASRHVLGVMNQMAFECEWHIDQEGGLAHADLDDVNRSLRRRLYTKDGDYRVPLELVLERLKQTP